MDYRAEFTTQPHLLAKEVVELCADGRDREHVFRLALGRPPPSPLHRLRRTGARPLDLAKPIAAHGRDQLYLRIAPDVQGALVSEDTIFLTPPRYLEL